MKLHKNLLVGAMAAVLALGVVACNGDDDADVIDPGVDTTEDFATEEPTEDLGATEAPTDDLGGTEAPTEDMTE